MSGAHPRSRSGAAPPGPGARRAAGAAALALAVAVPHAGPALAPAAGTVTFAGTVVDRGVVSVLHPDGRRSSVEPVVAAVVVGQQVGAGDVLGTLDGSGGHCTPRSCVHWGLREGDRYLDPVTVLSGGGPIVLLPVAPAG